MKVSEQAHAWIEFYDGRIDYIDKDTIGHLLGLRSWRFNSACCVYANKWVPGWETRYAELLAEMDAEVAERDRLSEMSAARSKEIRLAAEPERLASEARAKASYDAWVAKEAAKTPAQRQASVDSFNLACAADNSNLKSFKFNGKRYKWFRHKGDFCYTDAWEEWSARGAIEFGKSPHEQHDEQSDD